MHEELISLTFEVKMSEVDFSEDSHEILSSYSDSSEVGDVNGGCDFQNLQPYQF